MFRSAYGSVPVRLIAVPRSLFNNLSNALTTLVTNIIREVDNCFDHLERVAVMANMPKDMLKMNLLMSVFGNMTTVAACFDHEMAMHDSTNHDYTVMGDDEDDEDEDDEYEDYDFY
jgi:hypothetical protein